MRLEGSLDAFSLPDIFQLLSYTKKTGALHLSRSASGVTQRGVVYLADGAVTGASSDIARQSLARRLVGAGRIDDDALAAALERASNDEAVGLGRALRDAGAVDETALRAAAADHCVDAVLDLLRWSEGDFAFVIDEANPDELGASSSVEEVVTEGRRRLEEWATLAETIPSSDTALVLVLSPAADPAVSKDEWLLLALVDGRRTVADLVALSGWGEFGVVQTLADLVERGLVAVHSQDSTTEGVSQLLTRQAALAAYEAALSGIPLQIVVEPEPESAPVARLVQRLTVAEEPAAPAPPATPAPPAAPAPPATSPTAGRPAAAAQEVAAEVTPARPEPFLPRRRPEHPEEPLVPAARRAGSENATSVASAGRPAPSASGPRREAVVHGTSAVADPETVAGIERDPSVNKSLLLRLIAGVRGL